MRAQKIPADVEANFERLYRDAEQYNIKAVDGRPMASAWIDRFKNIYCAAQGYTNVTGKSYLDFRDEFMKTYRLDHDMVREKVDAMRNEKPELFKHGFSQKLIEEFRKI